MSDQLLHILSNSNKDIDNQKLMDYLSGKLSAQEKHEIEKMMADSPLMNDAIEGLENIRDKNKLQEYVDQLHENLQAQLARKKLIRAKKRIREYPWIYLAIVLVLIFCVVAYLIVRQFLK